MVAQAPRPAHFRTKYSFASLRWPCGELFFDLPHHVLAVIHQPMGPVAVYLAALHRRSPVGVYLVAGEFCFRRHLKRADLVLLFSAVGGKVQFRRHQSEIQQRNDVAFRFLKR